MYSKYIKRILDITISLIGLFFFVLIFLPVALMIKLEDKGPVFYIAKRLGKNGVPFKMLKFRSMKINAPDLRLDDGSTYNAKSDPRVTRIGKILRESSLDETPQVLNILFGQMSLIGPRPDLNSNAKFSEDYKIILNVKPGITGYNQAYFRNESNWAQKISNDKYYVEHVSFILDMKIIFRTIYIVLKKKNMYKN